MVFKTEGIVFKFFKYRETSVIVKVFTAEFGLQTYIINGIRSGKKGRMALLQPLTILDMVVYKKENADIQRVSEFRCTKPYESMPYDIRKSGICLFLSEILYKCIREESRNEELYGFLESSMLVLDHLQADFQNFHLRFLLKLSRLLGFGVDASPDFFRTFSDDEEVIRKLLVSPFGTPVVLSRTSRRAVLDHIIAFYRQHVEGLHEIRSLEVLSEIY